MANLFSGISDFLSGGQMGNALDRLARSSDTINNIKIPELSKLIPELKLQVQQGTMSPASAAAAVASMQGTMSPASMQAVMAAVQGEMTPEQAQAFLQSDSEMRGVQSDQGSLQGQRAALSQLADIGENRGLTDADRAQFAAVMNQQNANAAQQRAAQIQQLQMQGNAGSGAELAARLSGVQGAANSNAAAGADVAKSAQARALAAIQAGLAGNANLNTQMFDQAAKKAQAQDLVNQFNAQAQNTMGLNNAQMRQASNLANYQTNNQFALANQQAQNAAAAQNAQFQQGAGQMNFQTANQIAMQNAANQQAANAANAQMANQANAANFGMANQIAGTNVGIQNQNLMMPYNAAQADFTNQMNRAVAGSTADYRAGDVMSKLAQNQLSNTVGGINGLFGGGSNVGQNVWNAAKGVYEWVTSPSSSGGSGSAANSPGASNGANDAYGGTDFDAAGNYIGAAAKVADNAGWLSNAWDTVSSWFSDEDLKTGKRELSDADIDQVMGHLTGYKYRYKGDKTNPEQVGVMAQDMPRDSTIDTPAGKMIQGPQALNQALAVLANQHQRLKKLEGSK